MDEEKYNTPTITDSGPGNGIPFVRPEIVVVKPPAAYSKVRNVSCFSRYTFYIKLLKSADIDVFLQISYDGRDWYNDSPVLALNPSTLTGVDRTVLTAVHYSYYARVGAKPRSDCEGEIQVVLQEQKTCDDGSRGHSYVKTRGNKIML